MIYLIMWRYDIHPAARDAFEQAYGPAGDWAALFRASPDYLGTQLLCDVAQPDRYVTIDYWRTADAFLAFKTHWHAAYAALDQQCAKLTITEKHLGSFYSEIDLAG
jgi:heme-degrading monooxygenase HmoA